MTQEVHAQPRHFLDISDFAPQTLRQILKLATDLKSLMAKGERPELLKDKILAMIFETESTRTRVSFDVGMRQLGGQTIVLSGDDMQLSRNESIADTARVLSRYVDAIMIRILSHDDLEELAGAASVPVINGLTRRSHPCQIMADLMTFEEHRGSIAGAKVAWFGDANNVLASWIHATTALDFSLAISCPPQYAPDQGMLADIATAGSAVRLIEDPAEAAKGADLIVTDTWVSMGDADADQRRKAFKSHQVDSALMARAHKDALFMHCLPAHRGDEVVGAVIDGAQSVVFDEAENRLHAQKAVLCWVFGIEAL